MISPKKRERRLKKDATSSVDGSDGNMAGRTRLHSAVEEALGFKVIESLLATCTDVNAMDQNGETALYCGVKKNGDWRVINALLEKGGDVKCRVKGNNLLHVVGSPDLARKLLSLGVSVNERNEDGETPLFLAVKRGMKVELVESLLAAGADVNAMNQNGETALYCCIKKNGDWRVINALLEKGGDVKCSVKGSNLLHVVGSPDLARQLLSLGISVNERNEDGETPLLLAVKRGKKVELVESLLAAGADVNAMDKCGDSALYYSVKRNRELKMIKALLAAGGDVKCKYKGISLLHDVMSADVAREILSYGICVNERNNNGETPLHIAVKRGKGIELVELLLASGTDVNAINNFSETALHFAVENNTDLLIIKALLAAGGDAECRVKGNTLLHVVGTADVARELLSYGCNVNEMTNHGETPLHSAVFKLRKKEMMESHMAGEIEIRIYHSVYKNCNYFCAPVHELYTCNERLLQMSSHDGRKSIVCLCCRQKDLVWTLILHGAASRCNYTSPLDILLLRKDMEWSKFFIKADLMKSFFDGQDATIYLSSFRRYLNSLKRREILSHPYYMEHFQFLDDSVTEIVQMKCDMITDNLSLYNFFFKWEKDKKIFPLYPKFDNIEEKISMKYPIYRELVLPKIRASVRRSALLGNLKGLMIYVKISETKELTLRYYILREIAEYLSNDDLENLMKCVMTE